MKDKIENLKQNLQNNPELQEKIQNLKPKRSILGFLTVIIVFFVPEFLNYFYHIEINNWIIDYAKNAPSPKMEELLIWLSQKIFDGKLSFINITIGFAFLYWLFIPNKNNSEEKNEENR